jgi:hypothetical protein
VLGDRIGLPTQAQVRNLLLARTVHVGLTGYNRLRKLTGR